MRSKMARNTLVTVTALTALSAGGLVTAGTAGADQQRQQTVAVTESVAPLAVVNLGLSTQQAKNVQCFLKNGGWGYSGAIDGQLGTNSWKAMQNRLSSGYGYPSNQIDGIVGPNTVKALQRLLADKWGYTGAIDGIAGPATQAAFKRYANGQAPYC
ncbi:peptidoglycan-binding domain-containing protein [Streptomyces carpaticus]|uniref:Peptidoglycan-binding protein n=1 Tax=Streptomyces carpaticus TaxID=285558 RepID=A0ABV4ZPU7_9ACTN